MRTGLHPFRRAWRWCLLRRRQTWNGRCSRGGMRMWFSWPQQSPTTDRAIRKRESVRKTRRCGRSPWNPRTTFSPSWADGAPTARSWLASRRTRASAVSSARARSSPTKEGTSSSSTTYPNLELDSRQRTTRLSSSRHKASAGSGDGARKNVLWLSSMTSRTYWEGDDGRAGAWSGATRSDSHRRTDRADHREPRAGDACSGRDAPILRSLPTRRGASHHRRLPGSGEDEPRQGARALDRLRILPPPVHTRPAPLRRDRRQRFQPALERVRVQAWTGLCEHPARRRDQPCLTEDAGRPARMHAGAPGDRRRHLVPAAPALHGHGDAEPDRVRGDLPASRGGARPLHDANRDRLSTTR